MILNWQFKGQGHFATFQLTSVQIKRWTDVSSWSFLVQVGMPPFRLASIVFTLGTFISHFYVPILVSFSSLALSAAIKLGSTFARNDLCVRRTLLKSYNVWTILKHVESICSLLCKLTTLPKNTIHFVVSFLWLRSSLRLPRSGPSPRLGRGVSGR